MSGRMDDAGARVRPIPCRLLIRLSNPFASDGFRGSCFSACNVDSVGFGEEYFLVVHHNGGASTSSLYGYLFNRRVTRITILLMFSVKSGETTICLRNSSAVTLPFDLDDLCYHLDQPEPHIAKLI